MKSSSRSLLGLYTLGVVALFLAGFFLLVVFGAQSYRQTVDVQTENNRSRALLGYFATCISTSDSDGDLYVTETEYGPCVVIPDADTGYGLRIFCYEGRLMDDYGQLDAPLHPDSDTFIAKTRVFEVDILKPGLLRITTDAGSVLVNSRSEGGGEVS